MPRLSQKEITSPIAILINDRMNQMKDEDSIYTAAHIAKLANYKQPNMLAMIRTGAARLPLDRVYDTARALRFDPMQLFAMVMEEYEPKLWTQLHKLMGGHFITSNELVLIQKWREITGDSDPQIHFGRSETTALAKVAKMMTDKNIATDETATPAGETA